MVSTAVVWVPNIAPPVGLERLKLTVSSASNWLSLIIGMLTVLLVSPGAKLTVIGVLL